LSYFILYSKDNMTILCGALEVMKYLMLYNVFIIIVIKIKLSIFYNVLKQ